MVDQNNEAMEDAEVRTILEVQQDFAETLGYGQEIIWDLLSPNQDGILKQKIKQLLRGPLDTFGAIIPVNNDHPNYKRAVYEQSEIENIRETIFNNIWLQRKYTNSISLTSIIYVLVTTEVVDVNRAKNATSWSCHPVFRTRRCISSERGTTSNSSDCCMIFIDETGRVYQNWNSYINDNELPAGIMVAPERGVYKLTNGIVDLDKYTTPAASATRKVLGVLDTSTAIGGTIAACVPIAAIASIPVAAPVMLTAAAVGFASGAYASLRSAASLVDRTQHEQSINVTDRAARGHWLTTIMGSVSVVAAGVTSAMTAATTAGREVGLLAQATVNGINMSAILLSGSGVVNGIIDLILKRRAGDNISKMDVLQLSASLVLFTHSVYNFKLASSIISEAQNNYTNRYRETLSNRQRRMFDKMSKETIRIRGPTVGKMDIIRGINDVPSKQQFNDLYKINKQLNKNGVRPAFGPGGKGVVLNDQVTVTNTQELRASVQHGQGPDVLSQVTQPIPSRNHDAAGGHIASRLLGPNANSISTSESNRFSHDVRVVQLSHILVNGVVIYLQEFGSILFDNIVNAESFEVLIDQLASRFTADVFRFILDLTETFMNNFRNEIQSMLMFYISTESVLYRILIYILDNYSQSVDLECISQYSLEILQSVQAYFLSLNPNNYSGLLQKCTVCSGYFKINEL